MRDEDIGELSSFVEAENQSEQVVSSSMTQELCQIINSNEENSPDESQNNVEGSHSTSSLSGSANEMCL